MAKVVVNRDGNGNLVSHASNGSQAVIQTQGQNADHSNQKDTRN